MAVTVRFIDVGQGNMTLAVLSDGTSLLYDCHVTNANKDRVFGILRAALPRRRIDYFVASHREADHMRGVALVNAEFPIAQMWDCGVAGGTNSSEYESYMRLRLKLKEAGHHREVSPQTRYDFGTTRVRIFHGKCDPFDDANRQSIVIKIENRTSTGHVLNSVLLTGDSHGLVWKRRIVRLYSVEDLESTIMLGGHHGSITFFEHDEPNSHYIGHLIRIKPRIIVLSYGANGHGHPHPEAVRLYTKYALGSNEGVRLVTTDKHGTVRLHLNDDGTTRMQWGKVTDRPQVRIPALHELARGATASPPIYGLSSILGERHSPSRGPLFPSNLSDLAAGIYATPPPMPLLLKPVVPPPQSLADLYAALVRSRRP